MTQNVDSTKWTGLVPDLGREDVREAQRPVESGPLLLEPKTFRDRVINWASAITLLPLWAVFSFVGSFDLLVSLLFLAAGLVLFVAVSVAAHFWSIARSHPPALLLNEEGLHLPREYERPIPWSRVGKVEYAYGKVFRWVSVSTDPDYKLVMRARWPLGHLSAAQRTQKVPVHILSCWNIDADGDALIAELERFRDNYCAQ
ncbi:hypothetical protein [Erythrobacter sp. JK5]|uniref:hypothetical protein n=1 Tax=Erythrobacter sp. JK5 TaxID=2829500 RepID=UPI001BA7E7E4|nr:hypothetical protein [Erythrobacter sp. JK5]QUL36527.1 hypothetical protein KDC96_08715 [Erythrobacter sp. JK5]